MLRNTDLAYTVIIMVSTVKKSFEELGRFIRKTGKTISRWVRPAEFYYEKMLSLAINTFKDTKVLYLILDDTLLRKIYAKYIEGSGRFFDTKMGRRVVGLKLITAMVSNGNIALPLFAIFLFSKELAPDTKETRIAWIKKVILTVIKYFPHARIIVTADGAFGTKEFLRWCYEQKIAFEGRIRKNAVVTIRGENKKLSEIKELTPKGRQMARTIEVFWHDTPLYITAHRRSDKHGKETIVFQVSTLKTKPLHHVNIYQKRWAIEKCFRTTKQKLGLENCASTKLETQQNHAAAVLLAYALLQLDAKKRKTPNPESALRAANLTNVKNLSRQLYRCERFFYEIHV